MTGEVCKKCGGSGLVTRTDEESKADFHPILSRSKGVCDKCGGSGQEPRIDSHAANVAAAKSQDMG